MLKENIFYKLLEILVKLFSAYRISQNQTEHELEPTLLKQYIQNIPFTVESG